jgi:hypothetical protein
MLVRPYRRGIDQRSHGDVNMGTISNDRVKQRPTHLTMRVIVMIFADAAPAFPVSWHKPDAM